jgi:hypothetical protein
MISFKDWLGVVEDFDGEIFTSDFSVPCSFVWDSESKLMPYALQKFAKVLNSPIKITRYGVRLEDKSIRYEELDSFLMSFAGFCSCKEYEKLTGINVEE